MLDKRELRRDVFNSLYTYKNVSIEYAYITKDQLPELFEATNLIVDFIWGNEEDQNEEKQ